MREQGRVADAGGLLLHLEACLGPLDVSGGASERGLREVEAPFAVVCLVSPSGRCYATLGLSRHLLIDADEVETAQELVLDVDDRSYAIDVLRVLGKHVLERHRSLREGERHRLGEWRDDSVISGVMAVRDERLPPFDEAAPPVRFIRLLPITDGEARYARQHGSERVAAVIARSGIDLRDLFRPSTV